MKFGLLAWLRHTTFAHIVVWAFHTLVSNARNILLPARIAIYTLVNFVVHFLFYVRPAVDAVLRTVRPAVDAVLRTVRPSYQMLLLKP